MEEIWKECVGFEGYFVSNFGRMKSGKKVDKKGRTRKERILILTTTEDGYKRTNLIKNGKCVHRAVHRIVYETFIAPIPSGHEINHLNGKRDDNRPENLEAVTHAENIRYSKDVLKSDYATYGNARMTVEQRNKIFDLRAEGFTHRQIASKIGFSKTQVSNILAGKCWDISC